MSEEKRKNLQLGAVFPSTVEEGSIPSKATDDGQCTNVQSQQATGYSMPSETTDLERRLLAHERILRALIGHLADDDDEIFTQLQLRFGSGHVLGEHEQNFVSTEDYADYFMRSIKAELIRRKDEAR